MFSFLSAIPAPPVMVVICVLSRVGVCKSFCLKRRRRTNPGAKKNTDQNEIQAPMLTLSWQFDGGSKTGSLAQNRTLFLLCGVGLHPVFLQGFAELLRKCMSLRKRWRSKQKQRPNKAASKSKKGQGLDSNTSVNDDAVSEERMEFLAEKALGGGGSGRSSRSVGKGSGGGSDTVASELEELARGLGLGKAAEFDGEELEMASRLGKYVNHRVMQIGK